MNMQIVLSPAKSLNWESTLPVKKFSEPKFLHQSATLINELKKFSETDISTLMNISPALSRLNVERYQSWTLEHGKGTRPALFAFDGDVYTGLDAYTMEKKDIEFACKHLRILSGLYGILDPLDLIHPYRLEMGTKLGVGAHKNLYQFWGDTVVDRLNTELTEKDILVNLASEEYFKVIPQKKLHAKVIQPQFYDFKNGKYKIISFFAKKARGMMARYIIDHRIKKVNDIKSFDSDGYMYNENMSKGNEWVFTRG